MEKYKPSQEEFKKAEEMMTDEQKASTKERIETLKAGLDTKNWDVPRTPEEAVDLATKQDQLYMINRGFGEKIKKYLQSIEDSESMKVFMEKNKNFVFAPKEGRIFPTKDTIDNYFLREYGIIVDENDKALGGIRPGGYIGYSSGNIKTVLERKGYTECFNCDVKIKNDDGTITSKSIMIKTREPMPTF